MQTILRLILTIVIAAMYSPAVGRAEDRNDATDFFEREVRPLFLAACVKCHGPQKQEGGLRLDVRAEALRGGDSGAPWVAGDPTKSLIVAAIRRTGDLKMPPKEPLSEERVAAIERWIKLGAPWPKTGADSAAPPAPGKHWAFEPVIDAPPPSVAGVPADDPIEAFVRRRLNDAGLLAAAPADRRTMIRRATFDLTGLPPTPQETEAFERDENPRAYEHLIDRLLASPQYGEQQARHWLDVARYSDTKGYIYAREQRMWLHSWVYRDWVVKAFNDDLPYDRFLLLQIAADQAAGDKADLAAMGFLTLGRRFLGVSRDIIDDRIDVVTRGTMGLTVGCARCHDHKYDPIPTRDYYSLYGVFQNCSERQVQIAEPTTPDAGYAAFSAELAKRKQTLADASNKARTESSARARGRIGDYLAAQFELSKYPAEGFDQIFAKSDLLPNFVHRLRLHLLKTAETGYPAFTAWHAFAAIPAGEFGAQAPQVSAALHRRPNEQVNSLVRKHLAEPPTSREDLVKRYAAAFAEVEAAWQTALKAAADAKEPPPTKLTDADAEALRTVLYGRQSPFEIADESIVNFEYLIDSGTLGELWKLQNEVDNHILASPAAPHAVALFDRDATAEPRVFKRGNPLDFGDEVSRGFLTALSGPNRRPFQNGSGRLELAQAIVDPHNPLTARVMVNRVWMHHFGMGLVPTPSDFGRRAPPPSHPELLDWLASRLVAEGWSLKALHRRIMLSQTYRRGSLGPADSAALARCREVDPDNRLLWRVNGRRLSFEEMRDSLVAATGSLDLRLGGKASNAFDAGFKRRTLYGLIDRQFLPGALRVFDFANPDLHIPQRNETTVPQQALFFLNHPLIVHYAEALAERTKSARDDEERVKQLFQIAYQRSPSAEETAAAVALVRTNDEERDHAPGAAAAAWSYGWGGYDAKTERLTGFEKLPHFTGSAWQGGAAWPDGKLGWVQLTAAGGHAGNDLSHAAVRRWTAPRDMTVRLDSELIHDTPQGDGIRGFVVSSRRGLTASAVLHNSRSKLAAESLDVVAGDTLDFVVDIGGTLNNDQFVWKAEITDVAGGNPGVWRSHQDFSQQRAKRLTAWAQLAQVLLSANEFIFVD